MNNIKKLLVIFLMMNAYQVNAGLHNVPQSYWPIMAWGCIIRKPISTLVHFYNTDDIARMMEQKSKPIQERIEDKIAACTFNTDDAREEEQTKAKNRLYAAAFFKASGLLAYLYYYKNPDSKLFKGIYCGAVAATIFSLVDSFYELYKCNNYKEHLELKMRLYS